MAGSGRHRSRRRPFEVVVLFSFTRSTHVPPSLYENDHKLDKAMPIRPVATLKNFRWFVKKDSTEAFFSFGPERACRLSAEGGPTLDSSLRFT